MQMPKQNYDLNDNGKIDPEERQIMLEDRRRIMIDSDAKRDAQRRMAWFSLDGYACVPIWGYFYGVDGAATGFSNVSKYEQYILCQYCCYSWCLLRIYKHG